MSKLLEYFNAVDKSAVVRAAHFANPAHCMTSFGLTQDEQDALLSGDRKRFAEEIGIEAEELPVIKVPLSVAVSTTGGSGSFR